MIRPKLNKSVPEEEQPPRWPIGALAFRIPAVAEALELPLPTVYNWKNSTDPMPIRQIGSSTYVIETELTGWLAMTWRSKYLPLWRRRRDSVVKPNNFVTVEYLLAFETQDMDGMRDAWRAIMVQMAKEMRNER